jgi:hypothetical protein
MDTSSGTVIFFSISALRLPSAMMSLRVMIASTAAFDSISFMVAW